MRYIFTCFLLCIISVMFAQYPLKNNLQHLSTSYLKAEWKMADGNTEKQEFSVPGTEQIFYRGNQNIGESTYDLQTNATQQNRVINIGDETILACWTKGENNFQTGWPQRGTGYNQSINSSWDANPTGRIEANDRTGWPNVAYTGDGNVVVLAHVFNDPVFGLHMAKKALEGLVWTEKDIPTNLVEGTSWPRMVAGGSDGNSLHIISVYRGPELDGVTNQLVYYRSQDGGDTWDIQDYVIPGLDSSIYATFAVDQYAMDAAGNTIAIAVFSDFGDLIMAKSEDNGDTWAMRKVIDFPIDKYVLDSGIDTTQIPEYPDAPSSTAVFSSDGTGDIMIDADGKVHVVYGRMYLTDDNLTDQAWQYFPYTDGIAYWNEDMDDDTYEIAASTPDLNGNDTLDIDNWGGTYYTGISSQPSLGEDAEGNLFLVYSAVNELYVSSANNLNHRHVYLVTSMDGGVSWDELPLNVVEEDEDLLEFIEGGAEFYYPQIAKKVDHKAHIILQADGEPGIYVNSLLGGNSDDTQGLTPNLIWYLGQTNIKSSLEEQVPANKVIKAMPNPSLGNFLLKLDGLGNEQIVIRIYNQLGALVYEMQHFYAEGNYLEIQADQLPAGLYNLHIATHSSDFIAQKIQIQR